jgi:alkanesulfonate monooxygenase SsuD/methylene tetrahydromethanopterin reductase-like flavin-dependent oxidoreductase (luciferase family)
VQAGQSKPGRWLAAETADTVFCSPREIEAAKLLHADIRGRATATGRTPDHIKKVPAIAVLVFDSTEEAQQKRLKLNSLVHYDSTISLPPIALGIDASGLDPDGPLPDGEDLLATNASHTSGASVVALPKIEGLTVRQLAPRSGGYAGFPFVNSSNRSDFFLDLFCFSRALNIYRARSPLVLAPQPGRT